MVKQIATVIAFFSLVASHGLSESVPSLVFTKEYLAVTHETAAADLTEFGLAWESGLSTPRPHLLLTFATKEPLLAKVRANPKAATAILEAAHRLLEKAPRSYASPEAEAKRRNEAVRVTIEEMWQRDVGDEIVLLAFATLLDDAPQLRERLRQTVLTACRYPTWGRHPFPNMALSSAHLARGIAVAWDWHPDLWLDDERKLILDTVRERVGALQAGLYGQAYWARMYSGNHNHVPVCALSWCGIAFYKEIPEAPEWLAASRRALRNALRAMPEDGSSWEGVSYWSYTLSFLLQAIEATRSVTDSAELYSVPFLRRAAAYRTHVSTSGFEGVIPWGDARKRDYYGPQYMLGRLASQYGDETAQWLADQFPFAPMGAGLDKLVWAALWNTTPSENHSQSPAPRLDYHLTTADIVTMRSGWKSEDYLLSLKSGFTRRNHSHLDVGAIALAFGDEWLLIAPGYGKGFGLPEFWDAKGGRWSFYSNATESHSTLLVNGKNQRFDPSARGTVDGYFSSSSGTFVSADLHQAYEDVSKARRTLWHRRGEYVLIVDQIAGEAPMKVQYLSQWASKPLVSGNVLSLAGKVGQLQLTMLEPKSDFFARVPTSLHVDLAPEKINTYAVEKEGADAVFISLAQPAPAAVSIPTLTAQVEEATQKRSIVTLDGGKWKDRIIQSRSPQNLAWGSGEKEVRLQALSAALRSDVEGIEACLAIGLVWFKTPEFEIRSGDSIDLGWQRLPDRAWVLDSSADLKGRIEVSPTLKLFLMPASPDGESREYRFILAKDSEACEAAKAWLSRTSQFSSTSG